MDLYERSATAPTIFVIIDKTGAGAGKHMAVTINGQRKREVVVDHGGAIDDPAACSGCAGKSR